MRHSDRVDLYILSDNVILVIMVCFFCDREPMPFAECVQLYSFVLSNDDPELVDNITTLYFDKALQELLHVELPNKTHALTVFALCVGESELLGKFPHFSFFHASERKKRVREFVLSKCPQKI